MTRTVLVVGNGGREHALAWKAAQSPDCERVYVAPGNAGTAREPGVENVAIAADDIPALIGFAREKRIDLTIVGPEVPLVNGIADQFTDAGLACFGPSRSAARLEGSKAFTKAFLDRHGIPTAAYRDFDDLAPAIAYIRECGAPLVIKADGLAAGKGVIVAQTTAEAEAAAREMLADRRFGLAGKRIVVEEFLPGEEASFIAIVSGKEILPLATSQDHKARDEGDRGPNTGGMGAYSPAPVVTPQMHERVMREIVEPTVRGLAADGIAYTGFLYAGLMIAADGTPRVLEYNCRCGDPETQPIMARLCSDLVDLCLAAVNGKLAACKADWDPRAALGVVLAANGYPDRYASGKPIEGLPASADAGDDALLFHAGTELRDGQVVTAGGRVLCAVGLGEDVRSAASHAYAVAERISWDGVRFRRDIGHRAIARETG